MHRKNIKRNQLKTTIMSLFSILRVSNITALFSNFSIQMASASVMRTTHGDKCDCHYEQLHIMKSYGNYN